MCTNWGNCVAEYLLSQSYLVVLLPLAAFLVICLWLHRAARPLPGIVAVCLAFLAMAGGIAVAWAYFTTVLSRPDLYPDRTIIPFQTDWLNFTPTLTGQMGIYLDPISVMMMAIIVIIGFLVLLYSMGYMRKDPSYGRFFGLLSLFVFSMLGLVLAPNILQMFVFWELVGVSSYALIGFWYHKPSAVAASKKAFIVTRFADAFFLLGIVLVGTYAGSFDFLALNSPAAVQAIAQPITILGLQVNLLTLATLLIFAGGWGKSAMFPLHIWLPDAMEGPTPVSSIIHSATMVVAGIYLTARMLPLFAAADATLLVVQTVGSFTALFAAIIAITQKDIKRILAFSTLSQLGYMMLALGVVRPAAAGEAPVYLGYSASMFHIFTHAFFKCLLFLGAGIMIHAVHSNSLDDMGGLRRQLPWTYWSVLAACLAIGGIFPFAGFWSKDAILLAALQAGHSVIFAIGLFTGGLTALYMFRFFFLAFHGEPRTERAIPREDPLMVLPVVLLAVPSVVAGYFGNGFFEQYVLPPLAAGEGHGVVHHGWLPVAATLTGMAGIGLAYLLYGRKKQELAARCRALWPGIHRLVENKFYIDDLYLAITHGVIFRCIAGPVKWFDRHIVDATMDLFGKSLHLGSRGVRFSQSGFLTVYLGVAVLGIVFLALCGF
jgi:NADH-quinone oxidoreductase subunit L